MNHATSYDLNTLPATPAGATGHGIIARVASKLRRVAGMDWREIGYRSRQQSQLLLDRLWFDARPSDPLSAIRRHAPALADTVAAREWLDTGAIERYFPGVSPDSILEIRGRFPESCRHVLIDADVLRRHHFDLLGYKRLWFGSPIDWHLDPVWSRRAPLVHWSRIDALDPQQVGDSKVVWELNRHQWVVKLAQAFALSGDDRYADAAIEAIEEWIEANPPGYGINWASSLEVAMRLISWSWALSLLRNSSALETAVLVRTLASIQAHAEHIQKYLSHYYSPNTHLTGEALGLFYAGTIFPEFRDASSWRATGSRILIEQAERQISNDGVYFEQSTCYQRYTCEIYLHFLLLAERGSQPIPDSTREQLSRMLDFLLAVRRPDGSMPAIGDADGGHLMPLEARAPDDYRGLFALAAAVLDRSDLAWAAEGPQPELLWHLGRDGVAALAHAGCERPAAAASQLFSSGYAVLRSGWEPNAHQMIMDVGPLGCAVSSGHGHADLLSIQCAVFGEPCLVDAGTYGYSAEPQWRDYFRGTAAHSTVMVDGHGQAEPAGPFRWDSRPRTRLREWLSTPEFDLVDAEHNGYLTLKSPVRHRRRAIFVKPDFWLLIDDLEGNGTHSAELSFQFAPLNVTMRDGLWACADTNNGAALWIRPVSTVTLQAGIRRGETAPIRGWTSPDYGQRVPSPTLTYAATAAMPLRILTILYPDQERLEDPPDFDVIHDGDGRPAGVRLDRCARVVRLAGDRVVIERS